MIGEDYISFETAKLLKEKGFDEKCTHYYKNEKYLVDLGYTNIHSYTNSDLLEEFTAPTLQMTMKWLREVHNFNVNTELNIHGYFCSLSHIVRNLSGHIIDIEDSEAWETAYYDSYEQAVEAAIKYCLENLI